MPTGRAEPSPGVDGVQRVPCPMESRTESPQRQLQAFGRLIIGLAPDGDALQHLAMVLRQGWPSSLELSKLHYELL